MIATLSGRVNFIVLRSDPNKLMRRIARAVNNNIQPQKGFRALGRVEISLWIDNVTANPIDCVITYVLD